MASLLVLIAGGCALLSVFSSRPGALRFGHRVHFDAGLECADCHATADATDAPGMPVRGQCALCHADIDARKAPARRIDALFAGDAFRAAHVARLDAEILFSHRQHVASLLRCDECHRGIERDDAVGPALAVAMKDCQACHAQRGRGTDCAVCHREQRVDRRPPSHHRFWMAQHGTVARARGAGVADDCALCHRPSACASCHVEMPPPGHNQYFRLRGHGLHARMDRQNCAVCHRSDSCDACHRDTRPSSHRGLWGAPRAAHCVSCHSLGRDDDCATCHKNTDSHDLARPMPGWHDQGMNCRQCHGIAEPLPHVDNGSVCTACHR